MKTVRVNDPLPLMIQYALLLWTSTNPEVFFSIMEGIKKQLYYIDYLTKCTKLARR